jgi:hypothetical protein
MPIAIDNHHVQEKPYRQLQNLTGLSKNITSPTSENHRVA